MIDKYYIILDEYTNKDDYYIRLYYIILDDYTNKDEYTNKDDYYIRLYYIIYRRRLYYYRRD